MLRLSCLRACRAGVEPDSEARLAGSRLFRSLEAAHRRYFLAPTIQAASPMAWLCILLSTRACMSRAVALERLRITDLQQLLATQQTLESEIEVSWRLRERLAEMRLPASSSG